MNKSNTTIIILAAGKGTRMQSDLPKVLHTINGKTMLNTVLETAYKLNPNKVIVVVGYKKELVQESIIYDDVEFVEQKTLNGTGDAIRYCLPNLRNCSGNVLILSGDVPLIKIHTLKKLIKMHNDLKASGSLISTNLTNPAGYGRIIKNNSNQLIKIKEHKDATQEEQLINEINSGIYVFNSKILSTKIPLITNKNMQNEYYLTDIFNFIDTESTAICNIDNQKEISGVNTIEQLKMLEQ